MVHSPWVEVLRSVADEDDLADLGELLSGLDPTSSGLVLQIARQLERGRERAALLRVLGDTAADLTGLRDVQAVLRAISVRTRQLLGTDMAYVSLNDPEADETFIQEADGVRTYEYRTIRMPLGTGILGLAATGRELVSTSDYGADQKIVHIPDIDRIVAGEGVQAIMGVPLTVRGETLGALMVAMRTPKRFTDQDKDTVRLMARHAAVAVDNARRFAALEEAQHALEDALAQERDARARGEAVVQLDEELLTILVRRPRHGDLLRVLHRLTSREAAVFDVDGRCEVSLVDGDPPELLPGRCPWLPDSAPLAPLTSTAALTGRPTVAEDGSVTVAAAVAVGRQVATVVVRGALEGFGLEVLERAAACSGVVGMTTAASTSADERLHAEVLDDLLLQRLDDPGRLRASLRRFGMHPSDPMWVLTVDGTASQVAGTVRRIVAQGSGIAAEHQGHWCVLTNREEVADQLCVALEEAGVPARLGRSGPVARLEALRAAHRRADMALVALRALGRTGLGEGDELVAVAAVVESAGEDHPLLEALRPLLDHDTRQGTDLALTAWTYLEADGHLGATSSGLFIHRNTVRQRLARIDQLLGDDWSTSPRRLSVHLGLWIWRMQEHRDSPTVGGPR